MSVITKDLGIATAYGYAKSKGYTGTEEEFAELMASYADVAQQAEAAAQDAEDAKDAAVSAKNDAQSAQAAAAGSAQTASTKAAEASNSAQATAGSATAAGNSATAAAGSASTAQTAAQTATNKASEASSSASAASTAKTGAETARTGAQTAQTAAETAQENAEAAAASVSASAAQIDQNTADIGAIKNDLSESCFNGDIITVVEWESGTISANGSNSPYSGFYRTKGYVFCVGETIDIVTDGNAVFVFEYNSEKEHININPGIGGTKYTADATHTLNANTSYIRLVICEEPVDSSSPIAIVYNSSAVGAFSYEYKINKIENTADSTANILKPYLSIIAVPADLSMPGYIYPTTGNTASSALWSMTDYIDVSDIKRFVTTMATFATGTNAGLAFYDNSKTYISGVNGRYTGTAGYEVVIIDVPSNAKYVRLSFRNTDKANFFAKADEFYIIENSEETLDNFFGMQMFEKIGVISDSISCGWAKDKNGNNSRRNTGISWVQQMARRLGCTAYNLGASGVDPIEWFQSNYKFAEYCYTQYQSVGACDLYIIGLGLNQGTLGTVSDINQSDYTQNGATFYGQYARIIQMINAEHPDAIVMCLTEPTTRVSSYDQAVRDICALSYINAQLVDLENDYFELFNTAEILAEHQPDGLHFTPYGYSLLANAMVTALNDYISKHTSAFKYVGVVTV